LGSELSDLVDVFFLVAIWTPVSTIFA